jgi:hypothetical protein
VHQQLHEISERNLQVDDKFRSQIERTASQQDPRASQRLDARLEELERAHKAHVDAVRDIHAERAASGNELGVKVGSLQLEFAKQSVHHERFEAQSRNMEELIRSHSAHGTAIEAMQPVLAKINKQSLLVDALHGDSDALTQLPARHSAFE